MTRLLSRLGTIAALCVATAAVPVLNSPTPVAAAGANRFVQITTDKEHRTFNIHAKIVLIADPNESDQFMEDLAAEVKAQIEKVWSATRYKCWDVKTTVDVLVRRADRSEPGAADPDAIEIQALDDPSRNKAVPTRSSITRVAGAQVDPYSDSPAAVHPPTAQGSVIYVTDASYEPAWAHEFGHIIGLDDSYDELPDGRFAAMPGMPDDVMGTNLGEPPSPQTITRVLRRNGVDLSVVKCAMTMDTEKGTVNALGFGTGTFILHAWTCDYGAPSSDPKRLPVVNFQGALSVKGVVTQGQADAANQAVAFVKGAAAAIGALAHQSVSLPATPTFHADTGVVDYPVAFATAGVKDDAVTIAGPLPLTYHFGWNVKGLLRDVRPGATLDGIPGEWFAPIASLRMLATFTEGAKECP
jgi:hypothetical protein